MSQFPETVSVEKPLPPANPFRRALLHGLGVMLPPLLTVVFFLWAWNLISDYVLTPAEKAAQSVIIASIWDVRATEPVAAEADAYRLLNSGEWIPDDVFESVQTHPGPVLPQAARGYYERYVKITWLRRRVTMPLFLVVFALVLYMLGSFFRAGLGHWIWRWFEGLIDRLPVIRNVYSSVKQVTDFFFSEQPIGFNRVVTIEYPRRGSWAIAFVTGAGMRDITAAVNEPMLSVLVPTSPIPGTGVTLMVCERDAVDLNMTIDQAVQYFVSCGVVGPLAPPRSEQAAGGS
jgi:uncharacterized membrane protein